MTFFHEVGTAVLMVIVTLWLQCAGLAALIVWVRRSVADDLHRLGPFRSAALVVRLAAAVIALHGILILLWASCYRLLCFPSWESSLQLCHCRLRRCGRTITLADVGAAGEHYRRAVVRNVGERSLC